MCWTVLASKEPSILARGSTTLCLKSGPYLHTCFVSKTQECTLRVCLSGWHSKDLHQKIIFCTFMTFLLLYLAEPLVHLVEGFGALAR